MKVLMICFKKCFILFLLALTAIGCSQKKAASVDDFSPLLGTWKRSNTSGNYTETWRLDEDALEGQAVEVAGTDTVFLETMDLFERGSDGWVLGVNVSDQNGNTTVFFRLEEWRDGYFQFENQTHDFPRRIVYERKDDKTLHAFIDDGKVDGERVDFEFERLAD